MLLCFFLSSIVLTSIIRSADAEITMVFRVDDVARPRGDWEAVRGTTLSIGHDGRIYTDDEDGCNQITHNICCYRGPNSHTPTGYKMFAFARLKPEPLPGPIPIAEESLEVLDPDQKTVLPAAVAGIVLHHQDCRLTLRARGHRKASEIFSFECRFGPREFHVFVSSDLRAPKSSQRRRGLFARLPTEPQDFMLAVPFRIGAPGTRGEVVEDVLGILKLPKSKTVDRKGLPVPLNISLDRFSKTFTLVPEPTPDWKALAKNQKRPAPSFASFASNGERMPETPELAPRRGLWGHRDIWYVPPFMFKFRAAFRLNLKDLSGRHDGSIGTVLTAYVPGYTGSKTVLSADGVRPPCAPKPQADKVAPIHEYVYVEPK